MKFYAVSNLDIRMDFIANEFNEDISWRHKIFVQTKFFADLQVKKFSLLSHDPDVRQDAYSGLWEALITYDYQKNFDFYRWAQWNILKKIRDNRKKTKRFIKAKSGIKQKLNSCNFAEEANGHEAMLEASYLCKQILVDNNLNLLRSEVDIIKKSIIEEKTLKEIASDYNLCLERIRQIRNNGLSKICESLA